MARGLHHIFYTKRNSWNLYKGGDFMGKRGRPKGSKNKPKE